MALSAGARLGPYEIVGLIGAGGMGEVYRARDPRLGREIAVKVLPAAFNLDRERERRFEREARAAAALNHPNILAVYDIGTDDGRTYVVSELLRGETLRSRLSAGALSPRKTVEYAIQIAHGLAAAHDAGIVHRDLKPENLFITSDGHVKILDFGLAKPSAAALAGDARSQMPTVTFDTGVGVVLGTVGYMAPEQVTEQPTDHRADIFALGAICYEMLAGRRAFGRPSAAETMTAILKEDPPDLAVVRSDVPPALQQIVRHCLEKRPGERFQSTRDLAFALEAVAQASGPNPAPVVTATSRPWLRRACVAAPILILTAVAAVLGTWVVRRPAPTPPSAVSRFAIMLPAAQALALSGEDRDLNLSSDGTHLIYTAGPEAQLMIRAFDQLDAVPLAGIANARAPFFSPDGRWIGFFQRGDLKKVSMTGGPPITLCRVTGTSRGASWGTDDTIVFATSDTASGLLHVFVTGGEPAVLTTADPTKGEQDHQFPSVLPGGRGVLFTIVAGTTNFQVAVLDLETGERRTLIPGGKRAEYVETGHLVYLTDNTLWAVRFDLSTLKVLGDPVPVVDKLVLQNFSVSRHGTLVYAPVATGISRSLVWVNRQGTEEPIPAPPRAYQYPRLSPDGTRLAVRISDPDLDIWTWDLARQIFTRVTYGPGVNTYPVWTPDGGRIVFTSTRATAPNLYQRAADGTGTDERLTSSLLQQNATATSPDGRRVVFQELAPNTAWDLMLLSLDGTPRVEPLLQTPFDERNAEISPDGHWLAYESNESGQIQIYVRPFPKMSDGHYRISTDGGRTPVWAPNGRELFFVNGTSLLTVAVQPTERFSTGKPTKLFDGKSIVFDARSTSTPGVGRTYDVSRDGQRFVMIKDSAIASDNKMTQASMVVVQNWFEELKAKVPAGK
jgi:serine/threonine-protein kinase